ncbi:glucose-6-phosphate isomerase [Neisseria weaveri]|uniref:glucose-6-phosphate isomerase n=1 Tax=Neisseria weaveri TaxID=28091 RepID=UPI000D31B7CF|nr:glucose-6-phosphate isomerase [Neisseria weaveri]
MELTQTTIWQTLQQHRQATASVRMRDQFAAEPDRFERMHESLHGMLFDYSKNRVNEEILDALCALAEQAGVRAYAESMRRGDKINASERRAVLHTALRLPEDAEPVYVDGENVVAKVHQELTRALAFAEKLLSGEYPGATGETITDFVHIGIGGSDFGPRMVMQALQPYHRNIRVHFAANADDADIAQVLARVRPETTVFCIASKSFTTPETLLNGATARSWFLNQGMTEADILKHFVAVSSNVESARKFGIVPENVFAMFDWVGGRYSVWSAIGLPVMVAVGAARFRELLRGAHAMDRHFFTAPFRRNIPVLQALLGIWYNNFYGSESQTVVPYSHNLRRLSGYLQQLDMESNGKRTTVDGGVVDYHTGAVVFGEEGVNSQHAYFQLLHQGTRLIPVDFIVPMRTAYGYERHNRFTVANAFAQAESLMKGKTLAEAEAELSALPDEERHKLAVQKVFPGNKPSNMILLDELSPFNLGMLLAMYEHKIFVQGVVWGINSFDQWGVEYGKVLAKAIEPELLQEGSLQHDSSTNGLIEFYRRCRSEPGLTEK